MKGQPEAIVLRTAVCSPLRGWTFSANLQTGSVSPLIGRKAPLVGTKPQGKHIVYFPNCQTKKRELLYPRSVHKASFVDVPIPPDQQSYVLRHSDQSRVGNEPLAIPVQMLVHTIASSIIFLTEFLCLTFTFMTLPLPLDCIAQWDSLRHQYQTSTESPSFLP